jgi:membrane protease YdiL (CAAX protease family)
MRERIKNLSPRGEFFLIITICFAYFIGSSLTVLLLRTRTFELTPGRVMRGIATEIAILVIAASILRIRGWRLSRLSRPFSWRASLAGLPLFVGYIVLYLTTALAVVAVYPAAAHLATMRMIPRAPFLLLAVFIVVNSVFEEITVCGYVVTALSEQGAALSITASTLLRFLYHLYQGPIASLAILPLGLLFAAVYWRWRNLWPLGVAHTISNFVVLVFATQHSAG